MSNDEWGWKLATGNWQLAPPDPEGIKPFITPNPIGGQRKIKALPQPRSGLNESKTIELLRSSGRKSLFFATSTTGGDERETPSE
ncbi:MAG: hypothetical protein AB7U05_14285 [Mangrovibacterium sp.]